MDRTYCPPFARLTLLPLLALAVGAGLVRAEDPAVSQARIHRDLTYLASDECEGRGVGTKGIDLAADYIAREFSKAGLLPGGQKGTYFQDFLVSAATRVEKPATLVLTGPQGQTITLETDKNFTVQRSSGSGKVEAPVVFVGYGISKPKQKYDEYAGIDVTGKVVVVLRRSPRIGNTHADPFRASDPTSDDSDFRDDAKSVLAESKKAAAVLLVNAADVLSASPPPGGGRFGFAPRGGDSLTPAPRPSPRLTGESTPRVSGTQIAKIPVVQVKRQLVDDMLRSSGNELSSLEKDIDATLTPHSRPLAGWTCRIETAVTQTQVPVKNVVGVLEGSGPLANETVVVGAHYDHVGYGSQNPFGGTSTFGGLGAFGSPAMRGAGKLIHYGADDNASGTTAVMEMARRFASQKNRQGRRLVFIAFTAEESGLIGSVYYARNPLFPLDHTVGMINFDMVGRLQDDHLEICGVGTGTGLEEMVDRLALRHKLKLSKQRTGFGASDHQSFAMRGVPAMEFFTGFHEQYHMPTDRLETIDVVGLRRVVDLGADVAGELRTREKRPEYVRVNEPFRRNTSLWALSSSFGVIPHATDHKGGILIQSVIENTPAARSGLKAGDRIVAVGGQAAEDLLAYQRVVRALPAGEPVEVFAIRGERPQKFLVPLTPLNTTGAATAFGITVDAAAKDSLRIANVTSGSTAAQAGLKAGDRIVSLAGRSATGVSSMRHLLGLNSGDKVDLTYEREGKVQKSVVVLAFDPTGSLGRPSVGGGAGASPLAQLGFQPDFRGSDQGVLLRQVMEGGAAARAGLKANDVLTKLGDKPIQQVTDLMTAMRDVQPPAKLEVVYLRDGKSQKTTLALEAAPGRQGPPTGNVPGGARLFGLSISRQNMGNGAVLTRVMEGSAGARAGLKEGDRITAIDGKPVKGAEDYTSLLSGYKDGDVLRLSVQREKETMEVKMTYQSPPNRAGR